VIVVDEQDGSSAIRPPPPVVSVRVVVVDLAVAIRVDIETYQKRGKANVKTQQYTPTLVQ